jgi:hypothetical protein
MTEHCGKPIIKRPVAGAKSPGLNVPFGPFGRSFEQATSRLVSPRSELICKSDEPEPIVVQWARQEACSGARRRLLPAPSRAGPPNVAAMPAFQGSSRLHIRIVALHFPRCVSETGQSGRLSTNLGT